MKIYASGMEERHMRNLKRGHDDFRVSSTTEVVEASRREPVLKAVRRSIIPSLAPGPPPPLVTHELNPQDEDLSSKIEKVFEDPNWADKYSRVKTSELEEQINLSELFDGWSEFITDQMLVETFKLMPQAQGQRSNSTNAANSAQKSFQTQTPVEISCQQMGNLSIDRTTTLPVPPPLNLNSVPVLRSMVASQNRMPQPPQDINISVPVTHIRPVNPTNIPMASVPPVVSPAQAGLNLRFPVVHLRPTSKSPNPHAMRNDIQSAQVHMQNNNSTTMSTVSTMPATVHYHPSNSSVTNIHPPAPVESKVLLSKYHCNSSGGSVSCNWPHTTPSSASTSPSQVGLAQSERARYRGIRQRRLMDDKNFAEVTKPKPRNRKRKGQPTSLPAPEIGEKISLDSSRLSDYAPSTASEEDYVGRDPWYKALNKKVPDSLAEFLQGESLFNDGSIFSEETPATTLDLNPPNTNKFTPQFDQNAVTLDQTVDPQVFINHNEVIPKPTPEHVNGIQQNQNHSFQNCNSFFNPRKQMPYSYQTNNVTNSSFVNYGHDSAPNSPRYLATQKFGKTVLFPVNMNPQPQQNFPQQNFPSMFRPSVPNYAHMPNNQRQYFQYQ